MKISEINTFIKNLDINLEITRWKFHDDFIIWTRIRYQIFLFLLESGYAKNAKSNRVPILHKNKKLGTLNSIIQIIKYQIKLWSKYPLWMTQKYDGICLNIVRGYRV